jgi:hypothetical protein
MRYFIGEKLERSAPAEHGVLGLIDDAHASAAQLTYRSGRG